MKKKKKGKIKKEMINRKMKKKKKKTAADEVGAPLRNESIGWWRWLRQLDARFDRANTGLSIIVSFLKAKLSKHSGPNETRFEIGWVLQNALSRSTGFSLVLFRPSITVKGLLLRVSQSADSLSVQVTSRAD